mgnify:CR=1 FL=1|tara:strand:- start:481 stop:774 length:294 start_codon:yes stop_codon:yes gene_type:complete
MYLEIVSPEAILFSNKVAAVSVPGVEGNFQMLENHAAIVSVLEKGTVKIDMNTVADADINEWNKQLKTSEENTKIVTLDILSGTVEMKDNKVVILVD